MKRFIIILFLMTVSAIPIQGMEKNKEYNQKYLPDSDALLKVFNHLTTQDYLEYEKGSKDFKSFIAYMKRKHEYYDESIIIYYQIKTLVNLNGTCTTFNTLMPLKEIIKFCKTIPNDTKNKVLTIGIPIVNEDYCYTEWQKAIRAPKIKHNYENNIICSVLIQAGADPNTKCEVTNKITYRKSNVSVLSQATANNTLPLINIALAYKADPNEKDTNGTPLFFYAKTIKAVKLFSRYCNMDKEDARGLTVIWHALNTDYPHELMALYIPYFEKKYAYRLWDKSQTIIHKLIYLLSNYWNQKDKDFFTEQFLKKCESLLSILPKNERKHIDFITTFNDICMSFLIDDSKDKDTFKNFHKKATDLFKSYGCKKIKNFELDLESNKRKTPQEKSIPSLNSKFETDLQTALLLSAAEFEQTQEKKIYENVIQEEITLPYDNLIAPVKKKDFEKVRALLIHGHIDINQLDSIGNTPLIWAVIKKNYKIARILLEYGAKKDIENNIENTALMIAMDNGDDAIAEILLDPENQDDSYEQ